MEEQLALNPCQAFNCAEVVDRSVVFCDRHDKLVLPATRTALLQAYRPGKPPTKRYLRLLVIARKEISEGESWGHRAPREAQFDF